jgi:arylsulfatase A-like enzyme
MQGEDIQGGEPRGLPLHVRILPEYLRSLGYTTKLIGKWHVGYHTPEHIPVHRGFDSFFGFYNSHVSYYDYRYSHQVRYGRYVQIFVQRLLLVVDAEASRLEKNCATTSYSSIEYPD